MYARRQAALVELTEAVRADTALPTLLPMAAALVAGTLAVAYCTVWEFLPERGALRPRSASGWASDLAAQPMVELTQSSHLAAAVLGAAPIVVADWAGETRYEQHAALQGRGVLSSVAIAVPGRQRSFGCLCVDVTAHRLFDAEEIYFLQAVVNIVALAIERFQVAQTVEQRVEERTHAIEQRLVAAAQDKAVLEERQRLARDLHDSVIQSLYSVTLYAQGAQRLLISSDIPKASEALRGLQETAQEALDEMRLLIFDLRPPILEQIGLVAAVQARLNSVEGRANLQTRLIADGIGDLPALVEQTLYRIAQEALNNVLKHAHAQHVTVRLQRADAAVQLEINDDGVGFEPSLAETTGGMGLRGIAERATQLDGTFTLRSSAGAGTYMYVEVPL